MQDESIEKVKKVIITSIELSDINLYDKVELLVNTNQFLSNYNENIKILKRSNNEKNKKI